MFPVRLTKHDRSTSCPALLRQFEPLSIDDTIAEIASIQLGQDAAFSNRDIVNFRNHMLFEQSGTKSPKTAIQRICNLFASFKISDICLKSFAFHAGYEVLLKQGQVSNLFERLIFPTRPPGETPPLQKRASQLLPSNFSSFLSSSHGAVRERSNTECSEDRLKRMDLAAKAHAMDTSLHK